MGSVVAVAAVGLGVTVIAAGALGGEGLRVEPIVIDTSDRAVDGQAADPDPSGPDSGSDGDPGGPDSRVTGDPPGASSGTIVLGPVPTAPPPAPRSVAPIDGAAGEDGDEDDGSDEPDTPDDDDPGEDD